MKARHCDECKHAPVKWYEYKGPPAFDVLTCAKKHKPRYYMPRNAMTLITGGSECARILRRITQR